MSDDELLTMVQEACFRYYWEAAHANAGMAMAIVVRVERGFITREQGLERMQKISRIFCRPLTGFTASGHIS